MMQAQKLALLTLAIGGIVGLLVMGAAAAAGRARKLPYWLAGTAWGLVATGMLLSDCAGAGLGPSLLTRSAFPLFLAGVTGFPVALVWGQRPWLQKWFLAQLIMLVALGPAFLAAVISALCSLQ